MKFHFTLLDLLSSGTRVKIIKFLLAHEAPMSEREMASVLKISHMSVNRTMRELLEYNLVNFTTAGRAHLWKVNKKSYAFNAFSALIECAGKIREPLEDLKKTIRSNLCGTPAERAVLFGSIAAGSEKSNSDIDLFIQVKDAAARKKMEEAADKLSALCLEKYGNVLSPYILTDREIYNKKDLNIISAISKGDEIYRRKNHDS